MVTLEIIVIIQGNIEVLCIAYIIENIVYLKKFLKLFIMDLTMIKMEKKLQKIYLTYQNLLTA